MTNGTNIKLEKRSTCMKMISKIAIVYGLLFTINSHGIGLFRATVPVNQPNKTQFSLFIIEPLSNLSSLYYQSWTGYTIEESFYTQHNLLAPINDNLEVGAGIDNNYDFKTQQNRTGINAVIQYKLW